MEFQKSGVFYSFFANGEKRPEPCPEVSQKPEEASTKEEGRMMVRRTREPKRIELKLEEK